MSVHPDIQACVHACMHSTLGATVGAMAAPSACARLSAQPPGEFIKFLMKKRNDGKYISFVLAAAVVVVVVLVCHFLLSFFEGKNGLFRWLLNILMPFIIGGIIAYLLSPLCNGLEKFFKKRMPEKEKLPAGLSVLISFLIALIVIAALIMLIIPSVADSIVQLVEVLPSQLESANTSFYNFLENYPTMQGYWDTLSTSTEERITYWLQNDLLTFAETLLGNFGSSAGGIFSTIGNIFIGILLSVYMVGSRKKIAAVSTKLLYKAMRKSRADVVMEELHYADKMFNGFFRGRVIDSAIIGVICFIFTIICRFESAAFISVVVGITNIIPYFGPVIGAVPCALILLLENPMHCLIFLIFIVIIQVIDGNLLGPHILGQTTGISSFWVLFSVMFFGSLWGVFGMIIGVPLFAVIADIVQKLIENLLPRYDSADQNPPMEVPPKNKISEEEGG